MSKTQVSTTAQLKAEARTVLGSRASNRLRSEGRIPASIEWLGADPHVDLSIDEDVFMASRRKHQHVYEIDVAGKKDTAIVRHLDWDVFGDRIIHVEFRRVDLTKKTEVEVDVVFIGHPKGVLNQLVAHIKVMALPTEIPDQLEASVADLEPGTAITAGQIKLPHNVDLVTPGTLTLARIVEVKVEVVAVATPAEGAVAAEGATAAGTPAAGAAAGAKGAAATPAKGAAPAADAKKDDKKK